MSGIDYNIQSEEIHKQTMAEAANISSSILFLEKYEKEFRHRQLFIYTATKVHLIRDTQSIIFSYLSEMETFPIPSSETQSISQE